MKIKQADSLSGRLLFRVTAMSLLAVTCAIGAPRYVPFGVNFSAYKGRQSPESGTLILSTGQISGRLARIKGDFQWVRTFSSTHGMETSGSIAHRMGFKTALGAWISQENDQSGYASNTNEISAVIAAANRGEADLVIVGSEVLFRGDMSPGKLLAYIQYVRASIPAGIPVTTVDTHQMLIDHPEIISACDVVMGNFYPFWEGTRIDGAIKALDSQYSALIQASGSKPVWIAETGWPNAGNPVGHAVANQHNAAYYFTAAYSWAKSRNVNIFYFEAYDEPWKASVEGLRGARWGIFNSAGILKSGYSLVFRGYSLPEAAFMRSSLPYSELPGDINIQFMRIPPFGSTEGISGRTTGVKPSEYAVATYIQVNGGWWTKPYWSMPTVGINPDGRFYVDTVTGMYDSQATAFIVFLVPVGYYPPPLSGAFEVPEEVFRSSVACAYASRPSDYPGSYADTTILSSMKLGITRSWTGSDRSADIVSISGRIPIPHARAAGSYVTLWIGSDYWVFGPITDKCTAPLHSSSRSNRLARMTVRGGSKSWVFSTRIVTSHENPDWTSEGMVNGNVYEYGIPVFVPVYVGVNNLPYYGRLITGYYHAKENKLGVYIGSAK